MGGEPSCTSPLLTELVNADGVPHKRSYDRRSPSFCRVQTHQRFFMTGCCVRGPPPLHAQPALPVISQIVQATRVDLSSDTRGSETQPQAFTYSFSRRKQGIIPYVH